jgi:hypothetical protein
MVAMRRDDGSYATPQVKKPAKIEARRSKTGCGRSRSPWSAWPRSVSGAFSIHQAREVGVVKARRRKQCEPRTVNVGSRRNGRNSSGSAAPDGRID